MIYYEDRKCFDAPDADLCDDDATAAFDDCGDKCHESINTDDVNTCEFKLIWDKDEECFDLEEEDSGNFDCKNAQKMLDEWVDGYCDSNTHLGVAGHSGDDDDDDDSAHSQDR